MRNLWRNLSLGSRLAALTAGMLALLLGGLGRVLYINLRRFLLESTALRMRAQAKPVIERQLAQTARGEIDAIAADLGRALTSRDTNAAIFNLNGELLVNGRQLPEEPTPAAPRRDYLRRALKGDKELTYVTPYGGQRALVALIPLRRTPPTSDVLGVAQLTTPLTQVDLILTRQRRMISLGVLLTLGLGIFGELWLTHSSLAPLRRVIDTIRRITAGDLSQRVQLPHTRDEVGQLATEFDHMAGNIEATFASQSRFVSAAAHELRTPLTALQGSIEVLQRGSLDDPGATRSLLQGMHSEVTRLNRLTEQLLALTRLDALDSLQLKTVDLAVFLEGVVQQARYLAGERHLDLALGPEVQLQVDPDSFMQVFLNLIDNAAQHTDSHGAIEIGWKTAGQTVLMWVTDNGEGIAPEDLPHIFESFYRGDRSRSRRRGGAGLGLAIVQSIVHAHGGKIEVYSQPGKGARFTISLPRELPIQ